MYKFIIFITDKWLTLLNKLLSKLTEEQVYYEEICKRRDELKENFNKIKSLINEAKHNKNTDRSNPMRNTFYSHNE